MMLHFPFRIKRKVNSMRWIKWQAAVQTQAVQDHHLQRYFRNLINYSDFIDSPDLNLIHDEIICLI